MPHEVERPPDDPPVTPRGQPAGHTEHATVRVDRIQQPHARVTQLLDAAQGELHLRQRLALRPLLGDVLDLLAHVERRIEERGAHVHDALPLRLVDGGADVLPLLAGGLPLPRVDDHLAAHLDRLPSHREQPVALSAMHRVERGCQRPRRAIPGERDQIVIPFRGIAERPGAGERHAAPHAVRDRGPSRIGHPILVALPRGHEAHRLATGLDEPFRAGVRTLVDRRHVAHPTHDDHQHDDPEHESHALIHDRRERRDRHEREPHVTEEPDRQEPSRQLGEQRRGRGARRELARKRETVQQVHGRAREQREHARRDAAGEPPPSDAHREPAQTDEQRHGERERRQHVRDARGERAMVDERVDAVRREPQRHDEIVDDRDARRDEIDGDGDDCGEPTAAVQPPRERKRDGGGQQRAQHSAGHRRAQQVELEEAVGAREAGDATGERAVVGRGRAHDESQRAQWSGVRVRGDGEHRAEREHDGDRGVETADLV